MHKFLFLCLTLVLFCMRIFSQQIIISEVQLNPSITPSAQNHREWLEIQNVSLKDTIDINGWFLRSDLNDNVVSPIWGDAKIISWDSRYPGSMPNVKGTNIYPLVTTTTLIPPGRFALILDPTWNNTTQFLIAIPDTCIILTVDLYSNFGGNGSMPPLNGLLYNSEDILYLYDGDPTAVASQLIDSLSWFNNTQANNYSLQKDRDCEFKWYFKAPLSSSGGYDVDSTEYILATLSPGLPNYDKPSPIILSADTICLGDTAKFFIPDIHYCGPIFLKWNFGDPGSGFKNILKQKHTAKHVYDSAGTYTVSLVIYVGELKDTVYKTIYVAPNPNINLGNDTILCSSNGINLDAGSGNTYLWQDSSTAQYYFTSSTGIYFVEVTNSSGCKSSDTISVNFFPIKKLDLGNDTILCQGTFSISLDAGNYYSKYLWNTGFKGPLLIANKAGIYIVTVKDSNNCVQTDTINVGKNSISPVDLNSSAILCKGETYTIDPIAGNYVSYQWSNGSIDTAISVSSKGYYSVSVIDSNACASSDSILIINDPIFGVALGNDKWICKGDSIQLNASKKYASYLWSNGDTDSLSFVLLAGNYYVNVTDKLGCASSDTIIISNSPIGEVDLGDDKEICQGDSVKIKAPNFSSYTWSTADTNSYIYAKNTGTYSVTVLDKYGCSSSDTVQVNMNPVPVVSFLFNNICEGDTVNFSNLSSGGEYIWGFGDKTYSLDKSPIHIYDSAGTYTVLLMAIDNNGCKDTSSQTLSVYAQPLIFIDASLTAGCPALVVDFTNNTLDGLSYQWDFGDGDTSTNVSPSHTFIQSGWYDVSLTAISTNGCMGSEIFPQLINVFELPVADFTFSPDNPNLLSSIIQFTDISYDAISWQWDFGDKETDIDQNPIHMFRDTGNFEVFQIATNSNGCSDTSSQFVHIDPVFAFYAPSTFTPNGDGINDNFIVKGTKINTETFYMYIYDRWGNLIFKTNDFFKGWDGKVNGNTTQTEVYSWLVHFNEESGKERYFRGSVSLLR